GSRWAFFLPCFAAAELRRVRHRSSRTSWTARVSVLGLSGRPARGFEASRRSSAVFSSATVILLRSRDAGASQDGSLSSERQALLIRRACAGFAGSRLGGVGRCGRRRDGFAAGWFFAFVAAGWRVDGPALVDGLVGGRLVFDGAGLGIGRQG